MARASAIYTWASGSVAAYKATYQPMSDCLNTALPRTADTGQVNWSTVATEPGAGTVRDFEIFALGGPLQATAPVFVRVDYSGAGTTNSGVAMSAGTATDGAGVLGGLTVPKLALQQHSIPATPNTWVWAASDRESYLTFLYALDPLAAGTDGVGMLAVERTRDLDGTPNAAGFHVWRWHANAASTTIFDGGWSRIFGAPSQPLNADYNMGVQVPDLFNTSTAYSGGTSYAYPAYTCTTPFMRGASKALMFGFPQDFPKGQPITLTHYGQQMTFVPLAAAVTTAIPCSDAGAAATKAMCPLIRWD